MANHPHRATPATSAGAAPRAAFAYLLCLLRDDSGQDLVEYALIASFIGLSSVAGVHGIASQISNDMTIVLNGFKFATGQ